MAYEASLKAKWDTQNAFDYVRKEGTQEGIEEVAKRLLAMKLPLEVISKAAGLSKEEIENLR